jgi:hypothetical protein
LDWKAEKPPAMARIRYADGVIGLIDPAEPLHGFDHVR